MSKGYEEKILFEQEFYGENLYNPDTLTEKISPALQYIHDCFDDYVKDTLGLRPWDYIISTINSSPHPKILSIGSGPCGLEIFIAKHLLVDYEFTCLDINNQLLELGKSKAEEDSIKLITLQQDANNLRLDKQYDFILAHAALHHLIKFEHIFPEIWSHLSEGGIFFVSEPTPRNGMLLWPETKYIINGIFKVLPERLRYDYLAECGPQLQSEFPERDASNEGFECIRSQEIIPFLEKYFKAIHKFEGYGFTRRFVDLEFGKNYNLSKFLDKTILDVLIIFDKFLISTGIIKPENIFYVLKRNPLPFV